MKTKIKNFINFLQENKRSYDKDRSIKISDFKKIKKTGILSYCLNKNKKINFKNLAYTIRLTSGECGNIKNIFLVSFGMVYFFIQEYLPSRKLRSKLIAEFLNGKLLFSLALTEPHGGADLQSIKTQVFRNKDNYFLAGEKKYITLGLIADFFLVSAKYDSKLVLVFISRKLRGVSIKKVPELLGNRGSGLAKIKFTNVKIPKKMIFFDYQNNILPKILLRGRLLAVFAAIGVINKCLENIIQIVKIKEIFNKKMIEDESIRTQISKIFAAKNMIEHSAREKILLFPKKNIKRFDANEINYLKALASKLAIKACLINVELSGARGYELFSDASRLLREAISFHFIEGPTRVLTKMIFSNILFYNNEKK